MMLNSSHIFRMKKSIALIVTLILGIFVNAQVPQQKNENKPQDDKSPYPSSSLRLDINTMSRQQVAQIDEFINKQRGNRGFGLTLLGSLANSTSNIAISEIVKITQIRKNQKEEWNRMIKNECRYTDSLTYIDNLTDFYSAGSSSGALDPACFNFNGFTLCAQRDGEDVLRFYCHVDTDEAGLTEIYNHSKFRLVLDSLFFYPYRCHLPNLSANHIFPEKDKQYGRNTHFSFDDRDNLMVDLNFTITSSWYNEAILLAQNVELGSFNVQIPIDKSRLVDSAFVYKKGMEGVASLNIAGDCFIVPRSYMPLPGGVPHWGTGEYNVKVAVCERCNISKKMEENWKKDYRCMKRMKKENRVGNYFINLYNQNGATVISSLLQTASGTAMEAAGLPTQGAAPRRRQTMVEAHPTG